MFEGLLATSLSEEIIINQYFQLRVNFFCVIPEKQKRMKNIFSFVLKKQLPRGYVKNSCLKVFTELLEKHQWRLVKLQIDDVTYNVNFYQERTVFHVFATISLIFLLRVVLEKYFENKISILPLSLSSYSWVPNKWGEGGGGVRSNTKISQISNKRGYLI